MGALETVHAYDALHSSEAGRLDAEAVLELCRAAGYSEEASQKAARQRALERMRRDLPP